MRTSEKNIRGRIKNRNKEEALAYFAQLPRQLKEHQALNKKIRTDITLDNNYKLDTKLLFSKLDRMIEEGFTK